MGDSLNVHGAEPSLRPDALGVRHREDFSRGGCVEGVTPPGASIALQSQSD